MRTIPVLGTTPALFGMAAAGYVLCRLAGQPFEGEPIIRLTAAQTVRQMERLREREWQRWVGGHGCARGGMGGGRGGEGSRLVVWGRGGDSSVLCKGGACDCG